MEKLQIIKIGGNVIDSEELLNSFLFSFSTIKEKKILVHGGGKIATQTGNKLGIVSKYIDGRRITDDDTLELVTMVYGGHINKKIVVQLQSMGCDAIGITGADAGLLPAVKRSVGEIDYGWAGDLSAKDIPAKKWEMFLNANLIPVVAPLTFEKSGHLLNTNADTIAAQLAMALSDIFEISLIFCFEKKGILEDVNNENSLISKLDENKYENLKKENKIAAGILPKIQNAFISRKSGVKRVMIGNSTELISLIEGSGGTSIIG